MLTCKVCNREFSTYRALGIHLKRSHKNITLKDYYRKYIGTESDGYCPSCGKECNFISLSLGFHKYCSQICTVNAKDVIEKARNTKFSHFGEGKYFSDESLERIAKANHENAKERVKKAINTVKKKYNIPETVNILSISQIKEIKDAVANTNLKKYGNRCSLHGSNQEKTEKIFLKRYGYKNPVKSEKVKEKIKQTNRLRRNCDWPWADPNVIKKREENYFKKTGYKHPFQNPEIIEKRKDRMFKT